MPDPPATLRPLVLSKRQLQPVYQHATYRPKVSWGNPVVHYRPIFNSRLDVMTTVSLRTATNQVTARHYATQDDTKLYGIRKYPAQVMGRSSHAIEKLMKEFHRWNLDQHQMQHLLMPIQAFLHVDQRSFYTVSEHAFMTLADVVLGTKQWPSMLCHDEIWSVVKQVLTGTGFLASRGLQHTVLNLRNILITNHGVVKIGAIHHIEHETPEGWAKTSEALVQLAVGLIEKSKGPCSDCTDTFCEKDGDRGCCDSTSMLARVDSLATALDITRCLTEGTTDFQSGVTGKAILTALELGFIDHAKGSRLGPIAEFASGKVYREVMPVLRTTDRHGITTSSPPRHGEKKRPGEYHKLVSGRKSVRRRRFYGGGKKWLLRKDKSTTDQPKTEQGMIESYQRDHSPTLDAAREAKWALVQSKT
ncbi:hypothetical protein N7508_011162 [Penicillium antarcticum]|uniref:uncharacterized protein n=1 Tax=Penicillium antarcticum TaxID=416450 RepID=UPI00239066D1|nr:uncharacterized protein N7508_011148 [Penicillium antarcticum]XP_058314200.1 uncharacterized protein N7508_011162 [Penicillium antarcticum]KAJ5288373.1 hypothetical protein N7508_011148 [Penicillium antarcticum]KAJ5288387.1 hypothetical protein N7508_011162 [Penicillium antarcticum]